MSNWKKIKLLFSGVARFKRQEAVTIQNPAQILDEILRIKNQSISKKVQEIKGNLGNDNSYNYQVNDEF